MCCSQGPRKIRFFFGNLCDESEEGYSQFVRHDSIFTYTSLLEEHQVSFTLGQQMPGELMFIFEGAYHQGYNNGPNLAEAVNCSLGPREIKDYRSYYRGCGHSDELCLPIPLEGLRSASIPSSAADMPARKRLRRSTHHDSSILKRLRRILRDPKPSILTSTSQSAKSSRTITPLKKQQLHKYTSRFLEANSYSEKPGTGGSNSGLDF